MDDLHHPEYWEIVYNLVVRDPDGWRNEDIPWDQPISRADFNRLSAVSTCSRGERK